MSGSDRGPDPGKVAYLSDHGLDVDIRLHLEAAAARSQWLENQLEKRVEEIQRRLDQTPPFDPSFLSEPMNAWSGAWMLYTEECPPRSGDPVVIRAGEDGGPAVISDDGWVRPRGARPQRVRREIAKEALCVFISRRGTPATPILAWTVRTPLRLPEGYEGWPSDRRARWLWRATNEDRLVGCSIRPHGGVASESVVLLINWRSMSVVVRRNGEVEEYKMRTVLDWDVWEEFSLQWVPVKEWLGW